MSTNEPYYQFDSRLPDRFWEKVMFAKNGCWVWTAGKNIDGYGIFNATALGFMNGRAYRVAYEALVGTVPMGLELDHLCKHRVCVNPSHLEPVSHHENVLRGRLGFTTKTRKLAKTTCPQGHQYDFIDKDGFRGCRTCERARDKARRPAKGPANKFKTHCSKGHEYTAENTIHEQNSWRKMRRCRQCRFVQRKEA